MPYSTVDPGYVFDTDFPDEDVRLALGEQLWDGITIGRLAEIGVAPGWTCLELGAGRGSVARALAGMVGPAGRVVATDLYPERLAAALDRESDPDGPSVEVCRHDLAADPLPADRFDLVHARLVLQHLPQRRRVVAAMARALRPGGVLLIEDTDVASLFSHPQEGEAGFLSRVKEAAYRVMADAGYDRSCGLRNLELAGAAGLSDIQARGNAHVVRGGTPAAQWYVLWLRHLRPAMLGSGYATAADVDAALVALADPGNVWLSQVMISVSARKVVADVGVPRAMADVSARKVVADVGVPRAMADVGVPRAMIGVSARKPD
ncbi:class I SAM-dependent methyltransferase [Actinoplanes rectilineatus]|uniref:class I SAM-dependent methyltransferase n=1 Tax=Actinoplanes rectilineatus TaxID=113571 RepID=UPI0009F87D89|nr:methyltransferase domain-containing protein [Actinoplanes rectilineatus]